MFAFVWALDAHSSWRGNDIGFNEINVIDVEALRIRIYWIEGLSD